MLSFLNVPFPSEYGHKRKILTAFWVGAFVALFLLLFNPFSMNAPFEGQVNLIRYLGFGLVTILGMLFTDFVIPKLYPAFFEENNYTLGKEFIMGGVVILIIGLGNSLYLQLFFGEAMNKISIPIMMWQTFLIGIFPITLMTLLNYNKLLKSNLKASSEIQLKNNAPKLKRMSAQNNPAQVIILAQDNKSINLSDLAYMEAVGNYVNIALSKEGELSRSLYRSTLKSLEDEVHPENIMRCHRSYIVNLSKVISVSGNAQGLKLSLQDCDQAIPVSRKYIPEVKNYFAGTPLSSN